MLVSNNSSCVFCNNQLIMDSSSTLKRKAEGSPTGARTPTLRRRNSLPDMSVIDTPSTSSTKDPKKTFTMPHLLTTTLKDPSFMSDIAPILKEALQPMIQDAITQAITEATNKIIETVLNPLIKDYNGKIANLESVVERQTSEIRNLGDKLNDLEQYGRRNSIRLTNVCDNSTPRHNTDEFSVNTINDLIRPNPPITVDDIERSHPIGNPNREGKRQLLVKFKSYKTKASVFKCKSNLKNNARKVFLSEDLTKSNYALVSELSKQRKAKCVNAFWTHDGRIYAKRTESSPTKQIRDIDELRALVNQQ